ncbi:hypothetical protein RirG_011100 [Rhizophagus irregularis DAOM 197198w]|uniref:Uncharacterized protein n=1 Tax=Rhizophagus irregularis (strain DAOM 197198w) TaxID=1432141 RepID=A0A015KAQ8_RHIIW|nr:hypothetical protein RirG_011100 [Rhizophagus irregularis DAOM 197198w]
MIPMMMVEAGGRGTHWKRAIAYVPRQGRQGTVPSRLAAARVNLTKSTEHVGRTGAKKEAPMEPNSLL